MFGKRKVERHGRELAESFAQWLTDARQENPRTGFYVRDGKDWRHLEGESPTSQETRFDTMNDDMVFTFGVELTVVDGAIALRPNLIAVP
jgi:hypothetical protein